jgi:hypothetical protein
LKRTDFLEGVSAKSEINCDVPNINWYEGAKLINVHISYACEKGQGWLCAVEIGRGRRQTCTPRTAAAATTVTTSALATAHVWTQQRHCQSLVG